MTQSVTSWPVQELARTAAGLDPVAAWLDVPGARSLCDSFPQVFHRLGRGRRFGILDGTALVSHVATIDVSIQTDTARIRVVLIGSVATHPDDRRRGMARSILESVITRARHEHFDALVLWSGLHEFYARLGFQPAGEQFAVPVAGRVHTLAEGTVIRAAEAGDLPAILALHEAKPVRVVRSLADLALGLSARPMQTIVLECAGAVEAYACCDKGADFTGWWHELGGEDEDVQRLIESAMHQGQTVLVPPYRQRLLRGLGGEAEQQIGCRRLALTSAGAGAFFVDGLDSI